MTVTTEPDVRTFLQRLDRARGRTMVVHAVSGQSYAGILRSADEVSVCLESHSEDYEAPCILEIDATRVEAIEIVRE
jgi:hypothetical protein